MRDTLELIKCHIVEDAIRDATEDWLDGYIIQLDQEQKPAVDPVAEALETVQGQLSALHQQQDTIFWWKSVLAYRRTAESVL